jgi:hypothetical protein
MSDSRRTVRFRMILGVCALKSSIDATDGGPSVSTPYIVGPVQQPPAL